MRLIPVLCRGWWAVFQHGRLSLAWVPPSSIFNSAPDCLKFVVAILDLENNRLLCFFRVSHLEFSIWLLIGWNFKLPSSIWKTIGSIVLQIIAYCLPRLLIGYGSFKRALFLGGTQLRNCISFFFWLKNPLVISGGRRCPLDPPDCLIIMSGLCINVLRIPYKIVFSMLIWNLIFATGNLLKRLN